MKKSKTDKATAAYDKAVALWKAAYREWNASVPKWWERMPMELRKLENAVHRTREKLPVEHR